MRGEERTSAKQEGLGDQTSVKEVDAGATLAVTVALEEYKSLRTETIMRITAQASLVALNLTGIAAVAGLVLAQKQPTVLFLIVPAFSAVLGLLWTYHMRQGALLGMYLRDHLWPFIEDATGRPFPGWERWSSAANPTKLVRLSIVVPHATVFLAPIVLALTLTLPDLHTTHLRLLWATDAAAMLILTGMATWFALTEGLPYWLDRGPRVDSDHPHSSLS
jgi:hypothetical protein